MTTRVLSVASECVPLVKTGGLADVAGALPAALAAEEVEMRTLVPGYPVVRAALGKEPEVLSERVDLFGGPARVLKGKLGKQALYVLDAPHLYDRPGNIYLGPDGQDWPDNPVRFAALSRAAAQIGAEGIDGWTPQVIQLHDWQAALTPVYLHDMGAADRVGTVTTIHNIAFQGLAPATMLSQLGLPSWGFNPQGFEFYGKISALKAGIVYSDAISTVSPTYANELMTMEFGMGLDGVLRQRRKDLTGILNGIDEDAWTPPYKTARGKAKHRAALRERMGLPDSDGPLAVVISRLTQQKGLDLLLDALPGFLEMGGQLALLGSGDKALSDAYLRAAERNPGVAVEIGYDESLARALVTGGDVILVPSRFEPCGLTQMYGLRFGTLPVVALTGGLADTVIPASAAGLAAGVATGFQFHPVTAQALSDTLAQVVDLFRQPAIWAKMQRNAMAHPVGWSASAGAYGALFRSLVKQP
ncbi:glycogen synthase GlgA [Rhodobacterales bacterium HKCCE3408]|nr:glycogen synthase GlgA [Rhodobacterales bacterium HKCCE3408]